MSTGKIENFRQLHAWQKAHSLVLLIYKIVQDFPSAERFSLANQMTRAAVSVTSNIAEGFGRNTGKDKAQFYAIAKGSVLELQSQLSVTKDLGYISANQFTDIDAQSLEVIKLLAGLVRTSSNR